MKTPTRASLSIVLSSVALAAAISAPSAFAEERHGGDKGHRSDEVASTTMTTASPRVDVRHDDAVNDHEVNDDRGVDVDNRAVADDDD